MRTSRGRSTQALGISNVTPRRIAAIAWLTGGVPASFAVFVAIAYAIWGSPVPFKGGREIIYFLALAMLALSGGFALSFLLPWSRWPKILAGVIYLAAMSMLLPLVALFVGCFNGDCL